MTAWVKQEDDDSIAVNDGSIMIYVSKYDKSGFVQDAGGYAIAFKDATSFIRGVKQLAAAMTVKKVPPAALYTVGKLRVKTKKTKRGGDE